MIGILPWSHGYTTNCDHCKWWKTRSITRGFQLPGVGVQKDPQIWDGFEEGHKKSFGHFLHHKKEAVLSKMCNFRQDVNILDKKIHHLYEEAQKIKSCKKVVEYQLESIQQDISNIKLSEMAESTKKQKQQLWRPQL